MTVCGDARRGGRLRGTQSRDSARLRAHLAPSPFIMDHRASPLPPSQQAINGAFCIFVGGGKKDDVRQMLFGLSVLRHATEAQIAAAMPFVQASQHMTRNEIQAMLSD